MAGIIFGCIMLVLVGWAILKGKYASFILFASGAAMLLVVLAVLGGIGAMVYFKFIKQKPKTKGSDNLDDYDYGEDEEPTGEEDLDEDAEEEMDDEFTMDAEPEDEKL